eukprot:TRINITY_DN948_c0_g1_i1.p1 TRINITY_DN948_c0_g1~~TRINITY_DN948_c0_g1_i1.p1  ORF type:complete len:297 (+),score=52.35 TRINITY_DN948_c0_g1_i1:91-981(+)
MSKYLLSLAFVLFLSISLTSGFSVAGYIRDATTEGNIAGASVQLTSGGTVISSAVTSSSGRYTLPDDIPAGTYSVSASATGYVSLSKSVEVSADITSQYADLYMSPSFGGLDSYRIVLTWGYYPSDLDSHTITSTHASTTDNNIFSPTFGELVQDNCQLYFAKKICHFPDTTFTLDVDDLSSFGPETTTWNAPIQCGVYEYWVNIFSDDYYFNGYFNAIVTIYEGDTIIKTAYSPTTGGTWWNPFTLTIQTDGTVLKTFPDRTSAFTPTWPRHPIGCPNGVSGLVVSALALLALLI